MKSPVAVSAAVLLRDDGKEFLLAQRPAGKAFAGYWEFPGGKVEAGETYDEALRRELKEELGITVTRAWPWLVREFDYPHAAVRLKFFRVPEWTGEIRPIEHSGLCWQPAGVPAKVAPVLPANGPILQALALPPVYAITHATENGVDAELLRIGRALKDGLSLFQIRDKALPGPERRRLAEGALTLAAGHDARILINDDVALAQSVGAHGLHLSSAALMRMTARPSFPWVGASCHGAEEMAQALRLGVDFVVLSPVLPTPSHPQDAAMGWVDFAQQIDRSPMPVYALGGMRHEMLETARRHGAHGVAMLRGW